MEKENSGSSKQQTTATGKPARPHWRRRDPTATAVYVVHPAQFRTVVQQLTGAAPPHHDQQHQGGSGTATHQQQHQAAPATAAQQQQQHGSRHGSRTLGQIHQECMAWANADDDDD